MELTEGQIIEKYANRCMQSLRITFLPYQHELKGIACGYNVVKRKNELSRVQRKELNFTNR